MPSDDPVPMATTAPDADARALFERFSRRLIGLARCHLEVRLQHKVDPEDVVQSAYKSFFLRYGDGDLAADHGTFTLTFQVGANPPEEGTSTFVSVWRRGDDGKWRKHLDSWW